MLPPLIFVERYLTIPWVIRMLLYHYATQPFPILKTLEAQGLVTDEMRNAAQDSMAFYHTPGPYYAHISFFVDPLDLSTVAEIFAGHNHPVWRTGNVVYQHVVESHTLGDFDYLWTETPVDKQFMKTRWKEGLSEEAMSKYFADLAVAARKAGFIGKGNHAFEKAAKSFVGKTMEAYLEAKELNYGRNWQQYAANVPHVMIYPPKGVAVLSGMPQREKIKPKTVISGKHPGSANW